MKRIAQRHDRLPFELLHRIIDVWRAVLHILIAFAVVRIGGDRDDAYTAGLFFEMRIVWREIKYHLREFADGIIVARIADVVNLAAGNASFVFNNFYQRIDAVVDVGKRASVAPTVDERE